MKIVKFFKSIFYHISYGCDSLHQINYKLNVLLFYLENIGIKTIKCNEDGFNNIIIFNDDTEYKYWNLNRWYAWMSQGTIKFSNGKELHWYNEMPSYEVLYKFKKIITKKEQEKLRLKIQSQKDKDFSEYLPIKTLRKAKLDKIKKRNY